MKPASHQIRRKPAGAFAVVLLLAAGHATAGPSDPARWEAGPYSFSDELGGFVITGVSGTGAPGDPIVIRQELNSASAVTMTIRTVGPIRPFDHSGRYANGFLRLRIEVLNNSGLPWIEFEFELQERLGEASIFGDGLSFDQRRSDSGNIWSESFARYSRAFEPFDRLLFREGSIDNLQGASFNFLVTDFTPRWQFFLVMDPRIPSS